nr:MAG TPA: hypothetical protein [Caudoviricetes sp.]
MVLISSLNMEGCMDELDNGYHKRKVRRRRRRGG